MRSSFFPSLLSIVLAVTLPPALAFADEAKQHSDNPAAARQATPASLPFIYVLTELPRKLTEEQAKLILHTANERKPDGSNLWFIAVVFNDGRFESWSLAYYMPEQSSRRLRKGRYAEIHIGTLPRLGQNNRVEVADARWRLNYSRIGQYVQVSPSAHPFADSKKDARPQVPDAVNIPFPLPAYLRLNLRDRPVKPMTDQELVRLVDFARSKFAAPDEDGPAAEKNGGLSKEEVRETVRKELRSAKQNHDKTDDEGLEKALEEKVLKDMGLEERDDPICSIVVGGDDVIGIAAGVSDWGGAYLHIRRKKDGQFDVIRGGSWNDADTMWWPDPPKDEVQDKGGDY